MKFIIALLCFLFTMICVVPEMEYYNGSKIVIIDLSEIAYYATIIGLIVGYFIY